MNQATYRKYELNSPFFKINETWSKLNLMNISQFPKIAYDVLIDVQFLISQVNDLSSRL